MSREATVRQHLEIDEVNRHTGETFRLLKGVEANIDRDGALDLSRDEVGKFDIVLAAPHARLRAPEDQTARMMAAVETPGIHILAHPRGRKAGTREGIVADWDRIFARAAALRVAVEIDGDPSRQDLDHALAARALDAGCLFALDSDAHSTGELWYAQTAVAHARLAHIPVDRIVNTWPLPRLLAWAEDRRESP
jgi:putative hydrolase